MHLVVLVTCPSDSAERIAIEVLRLRLAACASIIQRVRSRYWWKGKLDSTEESLLLIKTRKELFEKLERTIKRIHPYEVPEIIGLRIEKGSRPYLGWITNETPLGTKKLVRR
jgi:periplasmic divalent cation tolerance protein